MSYSLTAKKADGIVHTQYGGRITNITSHQFVQLLFSTDCRPGCTQLSGIEAMMQVEYLWWAECPSHEAGYALLQDALAAEGLDAAIVSIEITSEEEAQRLEFIGSPTFRVNGRDLDPRPVPTG